MIGGDLNGLPKACDGSGGPRFFQLNSQGLHKNRHGMTMAVKLRISGEDCHREEGLSRMVLRAFLVRTGCNNRVKGNLVQGEELTIRHDKSAAPRRHSTISRC